MGLAAKSLGIPIFIHESDTIPGRSNRQLASMAKRIFLGFESSIQFFPQNKSVTVGQILDNKLFFQNTVGSIRWKTNKTHILLFCGSQGAKSVFEAVLSQCADMDAEWIVVLGRLNTSMRAAFRTFQDIQILDWLEKDDQRTIFEGTDIAVTR